MTRTNFKKIPFDLELAKKITNKEVKGRIVTQNGRQVRIICFDKDGEQSAYPIIALIQIEPHDERMFTFSKKGFYSIGLESSNDLILEVPTYYRDYSNFVPQKWQPCLGRENEDEIWLLQVSKGNRCDDGVLFYCPDGSTNVWRHCLPLSEATQRLIGTTKSYEELIKELDEETEKNL